MTGHRFRNKLRIRATDSGDSELTLLVRTARLRTEACDTRLSWDTAESELRSMNASAAATRATSGSGVSFKDLLELI